MNEITARCHGLTHGLFQKTLMEPSSVTLVSLIYKHGKSKRQFSFTAALYLKQVILCKKEFIFVLEAITLLFLYNYRAKSSLVLSRFADIVSDLIFLHNVISTIK